MRQAQKKLFRFTTLFLLLSFYATLARAKNDPPYTASLKGDSIKVGKVISVADSVFYNSTLKPTILRTNSVNNIISFRINEYADLVMPDSFKVELRTRIYYTNNNNLRDSIKEKIFTIDYNKFRSYKARDIYFLQNAYRIDVKIMSVAVTYAAVNKVLPLLELENKLVVNRDYVMNPVSGNQMNCSANAIRQINADVSAIPVYGELKIYWTPNQVIEKYDVEWTFIDKSALDAARYNKDGALNANLIFKNNATRVTTVADTCMIPMLYDGQGSLFYRIRGVQEDPSGELITTLWSSDVGALGRYDFTGHEPSLNWQATTSFAEEAKRKSVVQYFDGSLRSRQTVTRDNTTQTTIVAETFYDKQGRPAIQVLPAPTLSKLIGYTPGLNVLNMNSREYDKGIYDTVLTAADYCSKGADSMSVVSGASNYYSPLNPLKDQSIHQFIPDAKGYAFAETQYTQDNTGRISKQGGVGKDFQLGSGHETKYYYGTPEQTDLDALFGTEVGDATHYQKNMVRDANGQYSVSYVDMHGRTIATALAGESARGLQPLKSYRDSVQTESLLNITNNNIIGNRIESSKSLLVPMAGNHKFTYGLAAESLTLEDCKKQNICYDCLYDLTITITDDCNNQLLGGNPIVVKKSNFKLFQIDTTCDLAIPIDTSFSRWLEPGSYTITKVLSISHAGMQYYRDSIFLAHNTCQSYEDILKEEKDSVRAGLICNAPDEVHYEYESYRQDMLEDLYPLTGQYATIPPDDTCYTIFNNVGNNYQNSNLVYLDENGDTSLVINSEGQPVKPWALTRQEFIDNFQRSWAETLLPYHPEFPILQKYEAFVESLKWNEEFSKVKTYAEAKAKGYLNPTGNKTQAPASGFGILNTDPLFTQYAISGSARAAIESKLFNYGVRLSAGYVSLWGMATAQSKCANTKRIDESCVMQWNGKAFNETELCTGDLDMAWKFFQSQYLSIKHDWLINYCISSSAASLDLRPCRPNFITTSQALQQAGYSSGNQAGSPSSGNSVADSTKTYADANKFFDDNCRAYARRWWQQLQTPCNYDIAKDSAIIISYLIDVCRNGADFDHPFGSSTVKPGSTSRFKSFEEVIKFYNDSTGRSIDLNCNAYLIDKPLSYEHSAPLVTQQIFGKPDSCVNAKINLYYNQYTTQNSSYTNFSDFLLKRYQTRISQGSLDTLMGLGNNSITCKYLPQPINLPPLFQCAVSNPCIECAEFNQAYNQFKSLFPGVEPSYAEEDTIQQKKNSLFVHYMNQRFGFTKTTADYLDFKAQCDSAGITSANVGDTQNTCQALIVAPIGVPKPEYISCQQIITTYKNFMADFPHPEKGAIVKAPGSASRLIMNAMSMQPLSTIEENNLTTTPPTAPVIDSVPPVADSIQVSAKPVEQTAAKSMSMQTMSVSPMFFVGDPPLEDTYLQGKDLLEWYFNTHLSISGYTYEDFMRWLVNDCNYQLHQLPLDDKVAVCCDTLQTLLNSFKLKYPDSLGAVITETKTVPVHKVSHLISRYTGSGVLASESTSISGAALAAETWTSGGQWMIIRDNVSFNFNVLPQNATINNAALNLYAKPEQIEFFPCCGAHYRNTTDSVYGIFERVTGLIVPGQTVPGTQPETDTLHRLTIAPISISNGASGGSDLFSNENYLNQTCTNLVRDLYQQANDNHNYGVIFKLNKENLSYKAYNFWGITFYTPVAKLPNLQVNYSASRCDVFAAYINNALGTHLSNDQIGQLYSKCGIYQTPCGNVAPPPPVITNGPRLCGGQPVDEIITEVQNDPCADSTGMAIVRATERYRIYKDSLSGSFTEAYQQKCLNAINLERFTVEHPVSEYHYTLYYYDQAGNLVKTVSPEGVHPNRDPQWLKQVTKSREEGTRLVPAHTLVTTYRYNSLNQVVSQQSPDGGYTGFWYDRLGRLVVSRNAKQKAEGKWSYTLYDALGRITEVGQKVQTTAMTNAIARDPPSLDTWLKAVYRNENNSRVVAEQVTTTVYDVADAVTAALPKPIPFIQKGYTLRNRVAYTRTYDYLFAAVLFNLPVYGTYNYSTLYSYDIHGNVDTLMQYYRSGVMSAQGNNRFKLIAYKYDLISGKVNEVHYQPGQADQLYHRYSYDADNRLTDVYTSDNKMLLYDVNLVEHDARYDYYKHGPLARTVLGTQKVQGLDYAYTLQGWLKGVNATGLNTPSGNGGDMGRDGRTTGVARDAFAFSLNYFTGDYLSISGKDPFPGYSGYLPGNAYKPLYNGNISSMAVSIDKLNGTQFYNYSYDQLNRLTGMDTYRGFDSIANNWNGLVYTSNYGEKISYDANGNILSYLRNGNAARLNMDNMAYSYKPGTNQLDKVVDVAPDASDGEYDKYNDIKQGQTDGNYQYDAIGNLIRDNSERITNITWSVYGKILSITKNALNKGDVQAINYTYDAAGNRISKEVIKRNVSASDITWYVRDASGNVMAVYTYTGVNLNNGILYLSEQHLYGSSRIGVWNRSLDMSASSSNTINVPLLGMTYSGGFERGKKMYELTNHLGNVLVTISDKKMGVDQNSDGVIDYYIADVVSATDYYPFGLEMPGRTYTAHSYRYSFNGKEDDKEADAGFQDYGMREYDKKRGQFISVDRLSKDFAFYSPYQYAGNSPIKNTDLDGGEPQDYLQNWHHMQMFTSNGLLSRGEMQRANDKMHITDYEAVYDDVSKQYWFITYDEGTDQHYYWKHKQGADPTHLIYSTTNPQNDNGSWQKFETRNKTEADKINSDHTTSYIFVGMIVAPLTAYYGAAGVTALGTNYLVNKTIVAGSDAIGQAITNHGKVDWADVALDYLPVKNAWVRAGQKLLQASVDWDKDGFRSVFSTGKYHKSITDAGVDAAFSFGVDAKFKRFDNAVDKISEEMQGKIFKTYMNVMLKGQGNMIKSSIQTAGAEKTKQGVNNLLSN